MTETSDMGGESPASTTGAPVRTKLACRSCQKRKIKCDRTSPCNHCRQSGLNCTQGIRKRRSTADNGGHERNNEMRDRLLRLEAMVTNMQGRPSDKPLEDPRPRASRVSSNDQPSLANRYVGSTFWTSLAGEVQALKDVLEDENESDEASEMTSPPSASPVTNPFPHAPSTFDFIMCHPGRIYEVPGALPELHMEMQSALFECYLNFVDVSWKVFHVPTLRAFVQNGRPYLDQDASVPCNRALKAAIQFGGISQMTDADSRAKFGQPRADLVNYFRRIAEAALVSADLLNTKSLAAIQAFAVYVATSRKHDSSHRSWALFGLLIRLAQALGVDRESPDETYYIQQLRRRLWHHLLVLDSFFAYDRGSETTIAHGSFQRPLPDNVNDEDFMEYSTASTVEVTQRRPTDANFALQLAELYLVQDRLEMLHPGLSSDDWQRRLELTKQHNTRIVEKYTRHCNPNVPFQRFAIKISRIVTALNVLDCVRPFQRPFPVHGCAADPIWVLEIAIDVLRKTQELFDDTELAKWNRLPWVQWHPLAVVLASLCTMPGTKLAGEAWTVVDRFVGRAKELIADTAKGKLWKPVAKLYSRAMALRHLDTQPEMMIDGLDTSLGFDNGANGNLSGDESNAFGLLMPDSDSPMSNDWAAPSWLMAGDYWQGWQYPTSMPEMPNGGIGDMPWPPA